MFLVACVKTIVCLSRSDMDGICKSARIVILGALVTWFAVQVIAAVSKLAEGKIGTAEQPDREEVFQYPSLTMCPFKLKDKGHKTDSSFVGRFDSFKAPEEELLFLEQEQFVDRPDLTFDALWGSGANFTKFEESGIFSVKVTALGKSPTRCITYVPPGKLRVGYETKISMVLNATGLDIWGVFVHNKGMINLSLNREYGATMASLIFKEEAKDDVYYEQHYEIERTKWSLASTLSLPCSSDEEKAEEDILDCVYSAWESSMGCRLPWRRTISGGPRVCNTTEQYDEIVARLGDFKDIGEKDIATKYGCLASCDRFSYSLREVKGKKGTVPEGAEGSDIIHANFFILDSSYTYKVQYAIYDHNSLIADIGGYLGLLLGQSILTMYDLAVAWLHKK